MCSNRMCSNHLMAIHYWIATSWCNSKWLGWSAIQWNVIHFELKQIRSVLDFHKLQMLSKFTRKCFKLSRQFNSNLRGWKWNLISNSRLTSPRWVLITLERWMSRQSDAKHFSSELVSIGRLSELARASFAMVLLVNHWFELIIG